MTTLYQLGNAGYWTGKTREVDDDSHVQSGWTAREMPTIPKGKYARLTSAGWEITAVPPPAPPQPDIPPTDMRPTIAITAVEVDTAHQAQSLVSGLSEVTCPVGSVLTVSASLQDAGGNVIPLSDSFRMPIVSRDGREKVLLARMEAGVITITAPMRESGVWKVIEARINEGLPEGAKMRFAGLTIFVVETA